MIADPERIKRILADAGLKTGGGALRRATEVPVPPPPAPGSAAGAPPANLFRERLRARLEALDAVRGGGSRPGAVPAGGPPRRFVPDDDEPAPAPVFHPPADDGRPLEERLRAVPRHGPRGSFLVVETRRALAAFHGGVRLSEMLERPLALRRRERLGEAVSVDARRAVFLDVETTGLSGGTGTLPFLIGAGRVEGDEFVVRQYFLRDFPDEPAALDALAEDLGDAPLVTFNGRCFDWPLLTTRLRIHRRPVADRPHLDLLPPARRLWAKSLDSHCLSDLERHVLDVRRDEDLPGAFIPAAYFDWLHTGRSAVIALAFRHNEVDIVSLAALAGVVSRILADPAGREGALPGDHVPAGDHLGTARLLLDYGDRERARACLEAALARGFAPDTRGVRRLLGSLQRRAGDLEGARHTWERWIAEDPEFDPHPYEALAVQEEHRRKDLRRALARVEAALARCPSGHPARTHLEHRAARLRSKAASKAS